MAVMVPEVASAAVGAAEAGTSATAASSAGAGQVAKTAAKKPPAKAAAKDPAPGKKPAGGRAAGKPAADAEKPAPGTDDATGSKNGKGKGKGKKQQFKVSRRTLRGSGSRRVLVGEFVGCAAILALAPLTSRHSKDSPADWLRRTSALALLFLLLGLVATAGRQASRVAAAGGGLVTLALLVSERDVLSTLASRFTGPAASGVDSGVLVETGTPDNSYGGGYIGSLDEIFGPAPAPAAPPATGRSRPV